jgi:hypothetical protein
MHSQFSPRVRHAGTKLLTQADTHILRAHRLNIMFEIKQVISTQKRINKSISSTLGGENSPCSLTGGFYRYMPALEI